MKLILPNAPAAQTSAEAKAMAAGGGAIAPAAAAAEGRLWALVVELPNGRQLLTHGGARTVEEAREKLGFWPAKNPECRYDLAQVRRVEAVEAAELRYDILKRYPRRRTMDELGDGEWTRCFSEPWRVPGSRVRPPASARRVASDAAASLRDWGKLGTW